VQRSIKICWFTSKGCITFIYFSIEWRL